MKRHMICIHALLAFTGVPHRSVQDDVYDGHFISGGQLHYQFSQCSH